jgi:hypothetical protein
VTDRWLVVGGRRYSIYELINLRAARGRRDPLAIRAGIVAGMVAAAIVITGGYLDVTGWIGAGAVLLAPLSLVAFGLRRPRPYELWADYRGMTVQVFSGLDPERFNQICRALLRVQERRRSA